MRVYGYRVLNFIFGAGSFLLGCVLFGWWGGIVTGCVFLVGFAYGAWRGIELAS